MERFRSDGPRRIFFNSDGTPIARGSNRGPISEIRQKPDVTAADGVMTATPGFNPFFGTSASAPHAAGIAALFDELFPSVSVSNAYDVFRSSALDIDELGLDRSSGFGIIGTVGLGVPILADGFETGNTASWSSEVP